LFGKIGEWGKDIQTNKGVYVRPSKTQQILARSFMKGQEIFEKGNCVKYKGNFVYNVLSSKSFKCYDVSYRHGGCECLAFLYSGKTCKHWWAAHFYFLDNQHNHICSPHQTSPLYSAQSPLYSAQSPLCSPVRELHPIPFGTLPNKGDCQFCGVEVDDLVACQKCGDVVCTECLHGVYCFS
jgi:hypothetical protein